MADHPATEALAVLAAHSWAPQPEPAKFVHRLMNESLERCSFAAGLSQRMLVETGTRMLDWIDHFGLAAGEFSDDELSRIGYISSHPVHGDVIWTHRAGLFPRLRQLRGKVRQLAIKVDSVADFLFANDLSNVEIEGEPLAPLRKVTVAKDNDVEFLVVERHGCSDFEVSPPSSSASQVLFHFEKIRSRPRHFENDGDGFAATNALIDKAINDLGRDRTCDLFFAAERQYWQRRNLAGRIQLARQESLGLGWGNHDHHTYRSSRQAFVPLIAFLEKLGFQCRERFYAGREAGWGAQVIEHPVTGVTIFADVDMSPEELSQDFSHRPLAPRKELGTVGLWCALHGEAFLQAGLHHLECQFDFAATRDQLKLAGIDTMPPFTDFAYLRQAFTRGERWSVNPQRIERLRVAGQITNEQAQQFITQGVLGSHLEILQRNDGYKGFNQCGINEIITATDPRRVQH